MTSRVTSATDGHGLALAADDRLVHLRFDLGRDRRDPLGRREAERHDLRLEPRDRIARLPGLDLLARAVAVAVGARMAARAVGLALDQRRALARPGPVGRGEGRLGDGGEIVAVDDDARHRIGARPVGDIGDRGRARDRHRHGVLIVLADEDDRQLPDRGDVQRLVKRAFVVRAVAEKGDRDRAGPALLGAERGADGDRQAAADDAVGAEVAPGRIGDMHRAAAPPAIAALAPEELGEHRRELGALGDAMAVAAMGRGDVVGVAQRHADANRRRLLADRQMHRAVAQAADVGVLRRLLEAADAMHAPQGVEHRRPRDSRS